MNPVWKGHNNITFKATLPEIFHDFIFKIPSQEDDASPFSIFDPLLIGDNRDIRSRSVETLLDWIPVDDAINQIGTNAREIQHGRTASRGTVSGQFTGFSILYHLLLQLLGMLNGVSRKLLPCGRGIKVSSFLIREEILKEGGFFSFFLGVKPGILR